MLEILGLKICFVILIPRLAKEQNPCSVGGFMMVFFISGFNEPCPFQQLPRGWARAPRQGHASGRQGGQRGCREALPACRPREPGEHGLVGPQPRSRSWKLR